MSPTVFVKTEVALKLSLHPTKIDKIKYYQLYQLSLYTLTSE